MDEHTISPAGDPFTARRAPSTRHHRVDEAFLELLEEDFGISTFTLSNAFMGFPAEPKKSAIALCEWAIRAEDPAKALLAWARKNHRGTFRLDDSLGQRRVDTMCQKYRRRCPALLAIREAALMEWCAAETLHDVRVAWGRLGGRVTLHRYGHSHFRQLARRRR